MKTSELLIEAKKYLAADNAEGYTGNFTHYICHAIVKADGQWDTSGTPASPEARKLVDHLNNYAAVGTFFMTYKRMHGQIPDLDTLQASRHRYVDYLIAEYQAQGD